MAEYIKKLIDEILTHMGASGLNFNVEFPAGLTHGDYTTNAAMMAARVLKRSPINIAEEIVDQLKLEISHHQVKDVGHITDQSGQKMSDNDKETFTLQDIDRIEIAPPGFINLHISASALIKCLQRVLKDTRGFTASRKLAGKKVMVEFAHPNTHKAFHIGHLRNITTGESVVRLLESQGAEVVRANYQGDVGMHIAKALYALLKIPNIKDRIPKIRQADIKSKVVFLGEAYATGSRAYEENPAVKQEIGEINKGIYAKDPQIMPIYTETRQWSLDYFADIYRRVGTRYDRYYFESEVYESGRQNVLGGLEKGIFTKSDGAIIYPGEKFGLHNRVFITGEGNPTYEGKDIGLAPLQFSEYHPDLIVHVVGPEQAGYFQVVFSALGQLFPYMQGRQFHLIYGWVKLKQGKMSSRTGQVVLGEWLLDQAKQEIYNILQNSKSKYKEIEQEDIAEKAAVAAVKYSFLKVSLNQTIAFDIKESVSFEGDSGPYIQYTYARARSVIRKSAAQSESYASVPTKSGENSEPLKPEEMAILRLIYRMPSIVSQAALNYTPSLLVKYIYDLACSYNLFYNKHPILGSSSAAFRLDLTRACTDCLGEGLRLLGIEVLERM